MDASSFKAGQTPSSSQRLPPHPASQLRGRRRRPAAPAAPPWQDQTWQPTPLRAWHREGKLAGGAALPGGRGWGRRRPSAEAAAPPAQKIRRRGVGAAGPRRQLCREARGRLLGPRSAQPAHRGRSGPRPGAFRAQAAARPGKSRPPSRRHSPARQSGGGDSRNLPGDRRRVTAQNLTMYGLRFRCVSGESPGAGGAALAHCASCRGDGPPPSRSRY